MWNNFLEFLAGIYIIKDGSNGKCICTSQLNLELSLRMSKAY